jgi:hypothetical protein
MIKERFFNPETVEERELIIRGQIEKASNSIELVFDKSIKEQIKQKFLNNPNYALIMGSNHQSHADIFPYLMIADELNNEINNNNKNFKLNGFNMIIAYSLTTGHQNQDLKNYYKIIEELGLEKGIEFIPIVRPKDKYKYEISDVLNFKNLRKACHSYKDNYVLIEFPEGTVKGGRINLETGLPYGVQKTNDSNMIDYCIGKYLKKDIEFGVLPVAIDGTYKIYSPDTYKFTAPKEKIRVTVENLMEPKDFINLDSNTRPSDLIMLRILPDLSKEIQGTHYVSHRTSLKNL